MKHASITFAPVEGCATVPSYHCPAPTDGFTQASVESSQMSSTRGTAEVNVPGADTTMMQLDGGMYTLLPL